MDDGLAATVDTIYGLYLDHCNAYHVEANTFNSDPQLPDRTVGCNVSESGIEANEIYNNGFNDLEVGIECQGINKNSTVDGLCLKCNDFDGNISDIYINHIVPDDGIAYLQGIPSDETDPTKPAGNTFSYSAHYLFDINNECDHIEYIYHGINNTNYKIIPDENYCEGDIHLQPNRFAEYIKTAACPSRLSGGSSQPPKSIMALNEQKADSTQNLLNALVDGGNTEELNTDVMMSVPNEALEVNQQLLDESPYLSDTVMKSAIYKEDVLPNAMIRDILVANPQSAKSEEVLNALNDRWDPVPDYMIDQIMAGQDSLGSKEIMEAQVKGYRHLRDLAFNELFSNYMKDTVNVGAHDSLVALLQNENKLGAKYSLAFDYFKNGDTTLMNNELNNIPAVFNLSDEELQTHQNYLTYIGILHQLQNDSVNGHYPDSSQIATLFEITGSSNNLPSVYARNLLIRLGLLNYAEPVYFPVLLNSGFGGKWPFTEIAYPKESSLDVFPNPANNYFIVEYEIDQSYEQAIIIIHDMKGKVVGSYQLTGDQDQLVIPIGALNNGIYMVSMYINNRPVDTKKITILK